MKVNIFKIKSMVKVHTRGQMANNIKVPGYTGNNMVKEYS